MHGLTTSILSTYTPRDGHEGRHEQLGLRPRLCDCLRRLRGFNGDHRGWLRWAQHRLLRSGSGRPGCIRRDRVVAVAGEGKRLEGVRSNADGQSSSRALLRIHACDMKPGISLMSIRAYVMSDRRRDAIENAVQGQVSPPLYHTPSR